MQHGEPNCAVVFLNMQIKYTLNSEFLRSSQSSDFMKKNPKGELYIKMIHLLWNKRIQDY